MLNRDRTVFITNREADELANLFKDAQVGSLGWEVYEKCRKQYSPDPAYRQTRMSGRLRKQADVVLNSEQADFLAKAFQDARVGSFANNIYEKCRRRDGAAWISDEWR